MAMDAGEIERLIKAHIPDAQVTIRDLAGDGDHYAATVISASFKGKSRVQQHQMVYEALKGQMGGVLHALALADRHALTGGVRVLAPKGAIAPTGTWSVGARAGDFVFVAGMRGIDPANNRLVEGDEARIRQAFHEHETDRGIGGRQPFGLRSADRIRDRYEPVAPAGKQGAGATLERRALSAAQHRRSRQAQPGRLFSRSKAHSTHQKAE